MRLLFYSLWLITSVAWAQPKPGPRSVVTLQVPGRAEYCRIDTSGVAVLPSGRYVTPAGQVVRITHDPFGLAVSPDGRKAVALHDGVITLLDLQNRVTPVRIPDYATKKEDSPVAGGSFLGVAFAPDARTVYLSNGDKGKVIIFDTETRTRTGEIALDGPFNGVTYEDSFTSDLLLNPDANELLVLDRGNFRLVRIDLTSRQIKASIRVGRQPFGLALSPDKKLAFVANVGLFEYPRLPGVTPKNKDTMMLQFPAYGAFTKEMEKGVAVEGRKIPGLGSPNAPEAMSVWTINLATNTVVDRFKTGYQIGEMIEETEVVGGSSPNSVAVGSRYAYVSNATNDNISIIDYKTRKITGTIPLRVHKAIDRYRGLMPFGLALSRDEKTLYVALLAFNAVAVVDVPTRRVKGLIPTGWGPTKLALSPDNQTLYVVSARGLGAGPNGGQGFMKPPQGTYIGDIQLGLFQAVPVPDAPTLARYTRQVLDNTFQTVTVTDDGRNPLPPLPSLRKGRANPIRHIVYITKENRTYDEVLGQLKTGRGDSTLARFGLQVMARGEKDTIRQADVMPNHSRIAQQFAFSDNFYCDSDASIHGHHWMVGVIPNEWVEANSSTEASFKAFSKAPGRRFPRASGAIDPEDYNEIGGLWENLERHNISFYNFGEANEYAGNYEEPNNTQFGAAHPVPFPMPNAVFTRTSRNYAGYNTDIPDQFRMEQFETEFTAKWLKGKAKMPQLITMQVPNDHGSGPRPAAGYPFLHSYMADNDLAVGRILHFLSRTPYWKNMLVIITEDDPQGGVDHIDAHRSVLMMAGPYVKRNYVSKTHANFGSLLKVIYNLLGVPYVNQYDVTASLLQDFFTDKPDFRPYTAVLPDNRIFDPQKAMDVYQKTFDWSTIQKGPQAFRPGAGVPKMDDPNEQRAEHYRQQSGQ
ncbi:beta-propeller fold lactonase family protein [Nibrella viscosa]|uniref:Beta-propeller fold lactonase family protein n=1 Tax=Nibrella viscosa TaxID=1084524 RepID=A0ABP8KG22_9BACT